MECIEPVRIFSEFNPKTGVKLGYHKVPCGKCGFCLQSKRAQWMFRIYWEMFHQSRPGWFLTFTYNERFVKRTEDGLSLRFHDIQLFLKKLRKAKFYAKYVCVGEYGGETKRPHYHMLLWTDAPIVQVESFWSVHVHTPKVGLERLGTVHVGRLSMASAMYTLKYIINPKILVYGKREKVRAQFSKGLGLAYLSASVYDYHTNDYDTPTLTTMVAGGRVVLPRYYRYKIFTKYQMRIEGGRLRDLKMKEETKQFRKLRAQGIKKIRPYLAALKKEQAQRIINSSKIGLTL